MTLTAAAIIPLYNGEKYIAKAIESVSAQTVRPNELIVVDDGSTDAGPQIVKSLSEASGFTALTKPNGGQSSARNFGVAHIKSDLIAFLDQDDFWYPNHIEELIKPFQRPNSGISLGWSYSDLDEIDAQGLLVNRRLLTVLPARHPKRSLAQCLSQDLFVLPSASLISREAFESIGGFDESLSGYEDDDLFLRLFRAGFDNVYINRPLSAWRIFSSSSTFTDRMHRSSTAYFNKLVDAFPDDSAKNHYFVRDMIGPRFYRIKCEEYKRAMRTENYQAARGIAAELREISRCLGSRKTARQRLFLAACGRPRLVNLAWQLRTLATGRPS